MATHRHSSRRPHPRGACANELRLNVTEWPALSFGVLGHYLEPSFGGNLVVFRPWLVVVSDGPTTPTGTGLE